MLPKSAEIVVVGAGVIGASVAYHLAAAGMQDVLVLEREKFLSLGSTGRASGGVRYQFSTNVNIALSLYSLPIIEHFPDLFGTSCDYRPVGYIFLLTRPEELPIFRASLELQHSCGMTWSSWLEPDRVRELIPQVRTDDVLGATWCPKDGLADPTTINSTFARAAMQRGARIEMETAVTGIETQGDRVFAVQTNRGRVETRRVVNACGAWSAIVGHMVGIQIPVVPLRRQALTTAPLPGFRRDHPFTVEFATSLHFRPEGEGALIGMSDHSETPGYKFGIDEAFREQTLERAMDRMPLFEQASVAHDWAGLYEVTPDHHPILGEARGLRGFYIAAGFSGHGVMHSPAAGKGMSELILEGKSTTVDLAPLDLERFAEGRAINEVNVI